MQVFFEIFSNREIALIIWFIILIIFLFSKKDTRKSLRGLAKAFFAKKIIVLFVLMILYVLGIVFILYKVTFWKEDLVKDTVFWVLSVAAIMFFNINKVESKKYFKENIYESIKWTLILEFVMNFYTFSLPIELFLLPFIVLISATKTFAEVSTKPVENRDQAIKILKNTLSLIGIITMLFVLYKTIVQYNELFTLNSLKSLLLPAILTIALLPFIYLLALSTNYEQLFLHLKFRINDKDLRNKVKWQMIKLAKFNLSKVQTLLKNFTKAAYHSSDNSVDYIKSLLK